MNKLLLLLPVAFLAVGCAASPKPELITTKYKVVMPPEDFYNCPSITKFPNAATLTDEQVGQLLVKLQTSNVKCKRNIEAIRTYLRNAKKTIEGKSVY
jgi:hypothetical protein